MRMIPGCDAAAGGAPMGVAAGAAAGKAACAGAAWNAVLIWPFGGPAFGCPKGPSFANSLLAPKAPPPPLFKEPAQPVSETPTRSAAAIAGPLFPSHIFSIRRTL